MLNKWIHFVSLFRTVREEAVGGYCSDDCFTKRRSFIWVGEPSNGIRLVSIGVVDGLRSAEELLTSWSEETTDF